MDTITGDIHLNRIYSLRCQVFDRTRSIPQKMYVLISVCLQDLAPANCKRDYGTYSRLEAHYLLLGMRVGACSSRLGAYL